MTKQDLFNKADQYKKMIQAARPIPPILRLEYIDALRVSQRADQPAAEPFIKLIAECIIETQKDYCRLLRIKAN